MSLPRSALAPFLLSRRGFLGALALACAACRRGGSRAGFDRPFVIVFGPLHAPKHPEALRAQWSAASGLQLGFRLARTTTEAVDAIQSQQADGGLLSLFDYLYCAEVFDVEPVAQVVRAGDRLTHAGELVVRADAAFPDLEALRGLRVGYVDASSITGFLLPAARLRDRNVSVEPVWLGSHEAVVSAVRDGRVAAGATYAGRPLGPDLRVLAATGDIPNEPVFVQPTVPSDVREALVQALGQAHSPDVIAGLADATGFGRTAKDAYIDALAMVKAAGRRVEDLVPGGWPRANEHRRPSWSFGP
jgi:ABC-type phosphate/phosphonate transport system substrate-binding protein